MNARQLAQELAGRAMLAALRQWQCPSCGGSGTYHQNAADTARKLARGAAIDARFNPPAVPCRTCGGRGLHPTAQAAIAQAEAAGIVAAGVVRDVPAPASGWTRRDILAATDLELRGRLAQLVDRVGWEADTIRAELRFRAKGADVVSIRKGEST